MSTLFKDRRPVEDEWVMVDGEQPIPTGVKVIVPLARYLEDPEAIKGPVGVLVEAGESLDGLRGHGGGLDLIALDFPSYADGRAFSKVRLLYEEWGFEGDIRAVGDVRIDQVLFMERCGFTSLLVSHQPTVDSLIAGHDPGIGHFYQPAAGAEVAASVPNRPWLRHRAG
ncbi:MAG: DUF934 domain-containing protein [Pseudomonadota bacterium]